MSGAAARARPESAAAGCRYARHPGVVERQVDDAVFLVGADGETLFHLNATGAAVWRLLAEPSSIGGMAGILGAAFPDVAAKRIESDVAAVIARLAARGLVTRGG